MKCNNTYNWRLVFRYTEPLRRGSRVW